MLSEYDNMLCVLFIMDDMRKKSLKGEKSIIGDGLDWGVLFGFGLHLTIETVVLQVSILLQIWVKNGKRLLLN